MAALAENVIQIPHDWSPYDHQLEMLQAMDSGYKRAVCVWHRRGGKDSTSINFTAREAMKEPGLYWHCGPTYSQVRKFVWNNIDRQGRRVIDQAFPEQIRTSTNGQEMKIELVSGSIWQCIGSDNFPVGPNPRGIVFSEWSLCAPRAWDYIRPILAENGGWAVFIYTMRGKNHGYTLANMARKNPKWFYSKQTVEDTQRTDGEPIITQEAVEDERQAGMSEDMIQQEFYCSPDAATPGAYYAQQMSMARNQGRITKVKPDSSLPVHTAWDLGMKDSTAIWMWQVLGNEIRMVNYYENSGEALEHYIGYLREWADRNNCQFGDHWAPHDIEVRELGTGKSRREVAQKLGLNFKVARNLPVMDGIQAGRGILPRVWFDEDACEMGIACLTDYTKAWDDKNQTWRAAPLHNWASHGADAFRYFAVSQRVHMGQSRPIRVIKA